VHDALQHTPSTQLPEEHCAARLHAAPLDRREAHVAGAAEVLQK
jgi:hypothetical protein